MIFLLGIPLALVSVLAWSFSDVLAGFALRKESDWKVLCMAQFFGGFLMLLIGLFFVDPQTLLSDGLSYLLLLGIINLGAMYTFYEAIKKKGLALTNPIMNSWVLVTVFLAFVFYNETLNLLQCLAIGMIVLGILTISFKKGDTLSFDRSFFFAFLCMLITGIFMFLLKTPNLIFGAIVVTSSVKLLTAFFSLPVIIKQKINLFRTERKILFYIALIGILDALGFLFFNLAFHYSSVMLVSAVSSLAPLVTVLFGVLLLKEKLEKHQKLAMIPSLLGLVLISVAG